MSRWWYQEGHLAEIVPHFIGRHIPALKQKVHIKRQLWMALKTMFVCVCISGLMTVCVAVIQLD